MSWYTFNSLKLQRPITAIEVAGEKIIEIVSDGWEITSVGFSPFVPAKDIDELTVVFRRSERRRPDELEDGGQGGAEKLSESKTETE